MRGDVDADARIDGIDDFVGSDGDGDVLDGECEEDMDDAVDGDLNMDAHVEEELGSDACLDGIDDFVEDDGDVMEEEAAGNADIAAAMGAGDDGAYDHTEILDGDVDIVFAAHVVGEWSSMRFDACDSAGAGSGKPWSVATFDELRNFVHAHILPALNIVRWQSDWTLATTIEGHELQIAGQRSWRRAQAHWVRHHAKEAEVRLNFAAAGRAFIQSCSPSYLASLQHGKDAHASAEISAAAARRLNDMVDSRGGHAEIAVPQVRHVVGALRFARLKRWQQPCVVAAEALLAIVLWHRSAPLAIFYSLDGCVKTCASSLAAIAFRIRVDLSVPAARSPYDCIV